MCETFSPAGSRQLEIDGASSPLSIFHSFTTDHRVFYSFAKQVGIVVFFFFKIV
jgi:hypothetical protein